MSASMGTVYSVSPIGWCDQHTTIVAPTVPAVGVPRLKVATLSTMALHAAFGAQSECGFHPHNKDKFRGTAAGCA